MNGLGQTTSEVWLAQTPLVSVAAAGGKDQLAREGIRVAEWNGTPMDLPTIEDIRGDHDRGKPP
jgi:hypothetical protein